MNSVDKLQTVVYRPVDLARRHGLSTQAVRNYEDAGVLPPAERSPSGYRRYTAEHAAALGAYLAQLPAHGYAVGGEVLRAVRQGDRDTAFRAIDRSHARLLRDREVLDAVEATIGLLVSSSVPSRTQVPLPVGALARRLDVTPATLRKWERAGILTPERDRVSRHRVYSSDDVRDAELAHLLRRGGYPLGHIATVLGQVRAAGGAPALAESLDRWRQRLTDRGRAMLTAAARLDDYLRLLDDGDR